MEERVIEFLHKFERISHSRFDVRYFKKDFIKIFYSVYKEECQHSINKEVLKQLSHNFYKTLFLAKDRDIKIHLRAITHYLNEEATLEKFLSKLFFVVMSHYLKSCYKSDVLYAKVHEFSSAINELIEWSKKTDLNDFESEDIYASIAEHDNLMTLFEHLREKSEKIMLLNHYKSIPIQYPAKIVHTSESSIIVYTTELQVRSALLEGKSYILHDKYIAEDYTASVKVIELKGKKLLELRGFDKLSSGIVRRGDVRVHAPDGTTIKLKYEDKVFNVGLFDISFGGISVMTAHQINAPKYSIFKVNFSGVLQLANEVDASLIHVSKFEDAYKYHFKVNFSIKDENSVTDYITTIQKEIIKELKNS